ncbi:MAG: JAB domain-containing protein [Clostridiaceae bacterium]|nr:JAB domain-containing protein [Clostridiaceae bacterium]
MRKITPEYKAKIAEQWAYVCEKEAKESKEKCNSSEKIYNICADLKTKRQELFYCLTLNSKCELIQKHKIAEGIANSCLVHPREVFYPAIKDNAISIIVVHNHPSGETNPSSEDDSVTIRLKEAGKILGIEVLDHIIIGNGYYSYQEQGKI